MGRVVYVVHESWGRVRMRMEWIREERDEANRVADGLSGLMGVDTVEIRPFTGSVLVGFDPVQTGPKAIAGELAALSQATAICWPGEERPAEIERELVRVALASGSGVARAATQFMEEVDLAVLRATNGGVNLGTLAALSFMAAGAAEVVTKRKLPLPPWFQFGWWAFRTFSITEKRTIDGVREAFQAEIAAAEEGAPA